MGGSHADSHRKSTKHINFTFVSPSENDALAHVSPLAYPGIGFWYLEHPLVLRPAQIHIQLTPIEVMSFRMFWFASGFN
jgi:hypothetical protein